MRARFLFLPLFFALLSCKQACGLDEVEDGLGAGGVGASGVGAGGAGGAGVTATTTTATSTATTSTGGACVVPTATPICSDDFDGTGTRPCGFTDDQDCGSCGTWTPNTQAGLLYGDPSAPSGFWDGTVSLYHRIGFRPTEPFIAMTFVRTIAGPNVRSWPTAPFHLAGIVLEKDNQPANTSNNWFKAEVGTLMRLGEVGMRVARKEGEGSTMPPGRVADSVFDSNVTIASTPNNFQVAVCRDSANILHGYYRPVDPTTPWTEVSAGGSAPSWGEMLGPVNVGLVAAGADGGLRGEFGYLRVEGFAALTPAECLCWLEAHRNDN